MLDILDILGLTCCFILDILVTILGSQVDILENVTPCDCESECCFTLKP